MPILFQARFLVTPVFLLTLGLASPALSAEVVADSKVVAVTVFTDRAAVTRQAVFDLPAGASTLVFNDLPAGLFTDSLRTEGSSATDVLLGAIENKMVNSAELAAPRERELNAKLQDLRDARELLVADQAALNQKLQFLTTLGQQGSLRARENIAELNLKPEQWTGAAAALAQGVSETQRALAGKVVELRKADEQIAALEEELGELETGARSVLQVRVPVEAKAATRLTLAISYQLSGASWAPVYDARLDTASAKVSLTQFGEVRQQTGEDWGDVKLVLSTAQPARGAALPPLDPMWVDLYQAYNDMRRKAVMMEMSAARSNVTAQSLGGAEADSVAMPMAAAAPVPEMKDAVFQAATLNTGGYVSEYIIPGATSVLADGSAKKVMIGQLEVSSQLVVKVKPQISAAGFLVAVTKLGGEAPLLPGQASLFRDGAFIGSLALPLLRPGEETDLSFGIDDQVAVKQRVLKDETGESGVISKDNTRTRVTVTEVQNLHKMPVKVAVLQTLPASRNEQIKLELLGNETTPGFAKDVDNITGQYRWLLDLAPAQKSEVKLGWTLSWPKDQTLSGLPF